MEFVYIGTVGGGFPSPAEGWRERGLDIQDISRSIRRRRFSWWCEATRCVEFGLADGDLVVDRALEVRHGSIIVALVNGGFVVKRYLVREDTTIVLASAHPRYAPPSFQSYTQHATHI